MPEFERPAQNPEELEIQQQDRAMWQWVATAMPRPSVKAIPNPSPKTVQSNRIASSSLEAAHRRSAPGGLPGRALSEEVGLEREVAVS